MLERSAPKGRCFRTYCHAPSTLRIWFSSADGKLTSSRNFSKPFIVGTAREKSSPSVLCDRWVKERDSL